MAGRSVGGRSVGGRSVGGRSVALAGLVALLLLGMLGAACAKGPGGTSLSELRTAAKRVVGGGAECPLSIDVALALRPQGFDGIVQPDQANPARASDALIGEDTPDSPLAAVRGVRVVCRFLAGPQRITLVVVGVEKGHALSAALDELAFFGGVTKTDAAAFVNLMVDRRAGDARAVPGPGLAAVAHVATSDSSKQAVLVAVTPLPVSAPAPAPADAAPTGPADADTAPVPAPADTAAPAAEVLSDSQLTAVAAALADDLAH